jgi:flagellar motor component MotA
MNIYSILSFTLAALVFVIGVVTSTDNTRSFLDPHAALIVLGGTVAVTAIISNSAKLTVLRKGCLLIDSCALCEKIDCDNVIILFDDMWLIILVTM